MTKEYLFKLMHKHEVFEDFCLESMTEFGRAEYRRWKQRQRPWWRRLADWLDKPRREAEEKIFAHLFEDEWDAKQ